MIKLRPYQQQIITGVKKYWKKGLKKLLVFSCTRSGKTVVFSFLAKQTNNNGKKVLILTNRKTLFTQTGNSITNFGIKPYRINAETKIIRDDHMTYLAMSQTFQNRLKKPEVIEWLKSIDLVVVDECHISIFDKVLQHPAFKDKFVLGFTGSPQRSGGMPELAEVYQQIVLGPYTVELEPTYCVPARVYETPVDMDGVSKNNLGEFDTGEMFQRFDSPKLYRGAVNNWNKYAKGLTTIAYCVSIIHALKTCIEFNKAGIKTKYISSGRVKPKMKDNPNKGDITRYNIALDEYNLIQENKHFTGDTEEIIQQWRDDEFQVLINVNILTFGFDEPKIKCVLFYRATLSIPLFLQAINRGGTPASGKDNFIVLDFGSNSERLGNYNHKHEWSLFHKKPTGGGVASVKECDKCHALILASAQVCDWCGTQQPKSPQQKEIELIERTPLREMPMETIEDVEKVAKVKGYKKLWVFRSIYFKFGEKEFKNYMRSKNYHWSYIYRLIGGYAVQHKKGQ
jgi:superfamily II DNA or RNA helicase